MASFKFLLVSLIVLLCCFMPSFTTAETPPTTPGGFVPIPDVNATEIVSLANFAVGEHKRLSSEDLTLLRVVQGWSQVVAGLKYKLFLEASEGKYKLYEAVILVKLDQSKELISFEPDLLLNKD
uniref:Cystatin domain-containing protein n=2 Tax=Kalanchoe fedtschenkoi TaxID=63787 RepID=A0A7N0UPN0_KALFE